MIDPALHDATVVVTLTAGSTLRGTLTLVEGAAYVLLTTPSADGNGSYTGPVPLAEIASVEVAR